MEEVTPVI